MNSREAIWGSASHRCTATCGPSIYYYTFLGTAALCLLLIHVMLKSPIGYFMRAVRDDPMRAQSLAVDTTRVKLFAFVTSSAMAGLAGALYAHYVLTLTPSIVDFSEMARIIVMVVIGGLGSFVAPIIGAPPVYALNTWLAAWGEWSMVAFAAHRHRGDARLSGRACWPHLGRAVVSPYRQVVSVGARHAGCTLALQ